MEAEAEIPHSKSSFMQQRLYSCQFILNPVTSSIIYAFFCIICLIVGILCLLASQSVWEQKIRYDDICENNDPCIIKLKVDKDIENEIFIYYQLTNFFHSNYMYSSSKNWNQLEGKFEAADQLERCEPLEYSDTTHSAVLAPCGALPKSVFNDTFTFDANLPSFTKSGIVTETKMKVFKATNGMYSDDSAWLRNDTLFPDGQVDERFVGWIHTSAFPSFRKIWGKTDGKVSLKKGEYDITVTDNFPVKSFNGKKFLVFSEISWAGGKNAFLGIFFLVLSGINAVLAVTVILLYVCNVFPLYRALKNRNINSM